MAQYRYRTVALVGEWRTTREHACLDAMKARQCRVADGRRDGIEWLVPGRIETNRMNALGVARTATANPCAAPSQADLELMLSGPTTPANALGRQIGLLSEPRRHVLGQGNHTVSAGNRLKITSRYQGG